MPAKLTNLVAKAVHMVMTKYEASTSVMEQTQQRTTTKLEQRSYEAEIQIHDFERES